MVVSVIPLNFVGGMIASVTATAFLGVNDDDSADQHTNH